MRADTWLAINKLYEQSKIKAIGVSNFNIMHLMQLSELKLIGPMVNQIEWHPYYYNDEMLQYCTENNIRLQAHSSFGGLSQNDTTLIKDPVVYNIARRYKAGEAQILLLWALQKGVAVIPKSNNPEHLRDNMQLNFRISEDDMMLLDDLGSKNRKYAWDPTAVA
ncbi:9,11-endoperoxide prostaglandin H2 reductase-like [Maniola jurtina]|uniref:9,11-endoperoxide prostaglandin H2 reductase-like n=1 Tax=Maniola jurtina TaxID=191418 RepID=UPI001E687B26|nr:9,11-endoperoxide prostaglandin H2 reductase-like [Maniola jurtina]